MKIPVFDLQRQFQEIKQEILPCVEQVLASGSYILGREVLSFEQEFARYNQAKYAVGVASGTDALNIALKACGLGPGDEVITTPFTFVATSESIYKLGAKIRFADIDLKTYNIDIKRIEEKITKRTKAIICVHLYGQPCNIEGLLKLCRSHKLKLIEDCAQATGAQYHGRMVGGFGDAGCFSFYPTKNLGALGDGGMIISNNKRVFEQAMMLRAHGSKTKFKHILHGDNSRLDELQAAILRVKLKYLDKWNQARRDHAAHYNDRLAELEHRGFVTRPMQQENTKHVFHLYILLVRKRTALMDSLKNYGIGTSYHYPIALHLQKVYHDLGFKRGDFPMAEHAAQNIVTFPLYPELTGSEIDYIADKVRQFYLGS